MHILFAVQIAADIILFTATMRFLVSLLMCQCACYKTELMKKPNRMNLTLTVKTQGAFTLNNLLLVHIPGAQW